MQYVKMELAVKSDDPELKEENATYNKHIDSIANKDAVEAQGYYWAQTEAKVVEEGSMVVKGSNQATPITYPTQDTSQPSNDTGKNEPDNTTQTNKEEKDSSNLSYETFL